MELFQQLSRRQLDTLRVVAAGAAASRGVPLREIADRLGVRAPTALDHLTPLEARGLVARHRGKTRLTAQGERVLSEYLRHHRLTEEWFASLGLAQAESCRAAREVDLLLDHTTVDRICRLVGHPERCPHGRAIPPCAERRRHERREG